MINFNLVNNICEVVLISLFWAHNRLNELPEMCFVFAFNLTGKWTIYGIFNTPIMAHTQILGHSRGSRTMIPALFLQMELTRV